jgi:serine/threonine-protein kinase
VVVVIRGYTLGEPLARGGTAAVRRARRSSDGAPVAIKTVPLDALEDPSALLARYQRIAALDHPHILPILDVGIATAVLYTVMPLIEAGSLRQRLQRGQLDRHVALRVIRTIANALQYLHARDILHLDVKPANILLGNGESPLLSDFGLVHPSYTRDGRARVRGTPAYMAPEQCLAEPTGPASDQYALAILGFELLTGRRPFVGGSPDAMLRRQVIEPPPFASSVSPDLPRDVDAVFTRGLAKEPSRRFASVTELAEGLRRALSNAPDHPPAHPLDLAPDAETLELVTLELVPAAHRPACNSACN